MSMYRYAIPHASDDLDTCSVTWAGFILSLFFGGPQAGLVSRRSAPPPLEMASKHSDDADNDDVRPIELPIAPNVGIQIVAPSWQAGTTTHAPSGRPVPFSIQGPAACIDFLEREVPGAGLGGWLSPPFKITIRGARAGSAGIPPNAAFYTYAAC